MAMIVDKCCQKLIERAKGAPRLTSFEERQLLAAWRERRERRAAERLIEANQRHVVFTALEYKRYGVPLEDLIGEGNVGLMKALERFDAGRNVRFATYAVYWIRAQIVLGVLDSWSLLSGPRGALDSRVFFRLRRARARIAARAPASDAAGEPSPLEQLANEFGVSERRMEEMLAQLDRRGLSLDGVAGASEVWSLPELRSEADQSERLERRERSEQVARIVGCVRGELDPREAFIVDRRLLADPEDELSLSEIGAFFGVSRERVRQIEVRAQKKLRTHGLREDGGAAAPSTTSSSAA
jgi:RNA polymerase sigma-32 factor